MKRISSILSLVVLVLFATSFFIDSKNNLTAKGNSDILWIADRPLTWSDFEAEPDYDNDFIKALTASSIRYSYGCKDGEIDFQIDAIFKKDQSWVKEVARTSYHLGHEQLHFDITELYARKLRKVLKEKKYPCHRMYAFEQTIKDHLEKWRLEQRTYDKETFFSVKEEEQSNWYFQINLQLDSDLHDFSSHPEN